jgi:hypothetical protein
MIFNKSKLMPLDIVVINPVIFSSIFDRIKEYGPVLKKEITARIGFNIDLHGVDFIFYYDHGFKLVPYSTLEKRISSVKRNWVFGEEHESVKFQSKLLRNLVAQIEHKTTVATIAEEMNNGDFNATLFYIITADKIEYPAVFADCDIKMEDLFDEELGFFNVYKGEQNV